MTANSDGSFAQEGTEDGGFIHWLVYIALVGYFRLYMLLYLADSRYREFRADRVSAEVCGPQNVRNALTRTLVVAHLSELSIQALLSEFVRGGRDVDNIYQEHRRRWETLDAARRERAENELFMSPTSAWDTHPRLADRIRNLADAQAAELKIDQPATKLFRQWDALEHQMTAGRWRSAR